MADGGTGTNVSGQLGVCRSEPCSNGALVGRESRQNAVRDRTNLDPKVTAQGYQQTRSASSDPRPTCSPSEYFSLKTSHNNAVPMNNHSTGVAATALNGCFVNGSKTPATKTEDWHSYRNPADKITESNLRPGGISRRSGIPVSSMLLLFISGIYVYFRKCLSYGQAHTVMLSCKDYGQHDNQSALPTG